nr:MMPL family transporter [Kofleriaceae bacterium]
MVAVYVAVLALAAYLIAFHLPLYADFSYLLPQDAPSVQDLRRLEARVKSTETVLVVVTAPTSEARAAAVAEMSAGVRMLPKDLVEVVEDDDAEIRGFLAAHRFVYVPLPELQAAETALKERLAAAKCHANPLCVDFADNGSADDAAAKQQLDKLRDERRDADARLARSSHVSADGKVAMIEVRIAFGTTDADRGEQLISALDGVAAGVRAAHPGVEMGFTGGIITGVSEHRAISNGIVLSSIVTGLLVALVLALYFRSATLLVLLTGTIIVATAVAFGAAALTIGHLNAATAFLGAIIAGNGVNYGILLIARFLEERRGRAGDADTALARAMVGTLRPTAIASLGAAIAYGSLAATSFKGFADFAVIGSIGMLVCWIASYTLLPVLVLRFATTTRVFTGDPLVGGMLVRLIGFRRSGVVCAVAATMALGAGVVVARYVAADPFEYDMKKLRSEGDDAAEARRWMKLSDDTFGRGFAGRTFIAADRAQDVPDIVAALLAIDHGKPVAQQTFGAVRSILDVVPADQAQRIAALGRIRTMLGDPALDGLDDDERATLAELRPPDVIEPVTVASLPASLRDRPEITDANGGTGLMISIHTANTLDEWNGHDLIRFANAVRRVDLPGGRTVTTSGTAVIFADILEAVEHDGPIVTAIAAALLVVMVVMLVGVTRRAAAVLVATAMGSLMMVAACALLGLKVNFLDFVALPITLGLGIDYAINVAHRHDTEDVPDPIVTLRTSGSAVFVCSLTTMIGYGSLLVSDNLAIRGFGTASLIGEITCCTSALVLVPAILALRPRRVAVEAAEPAA